MTYRCRFKNELGFTLIELLLVLSLISIVSVVSISIVGSSVDEARFNDTTARMQQVKAAAIGNIDQREGNARTSFGYLGDMGAVPSNSATLSALTTRPTGAPNWAVNTTVRFGLGWNGPYLSSSFSSNPLQDAWGNNFIYNANANPPTITSLGSDGVAGGTGYKQDIVLTLPNELRLANVYGFISDAGGPYLSTATVDLNYPNGSGAVQTATTNLTAADRGYFQFSNIPLGKRSVTAYVPNKTSPTKTIGPILISVDQGNYLVPTNLIDINPGGGGGNGGGGGGGGSTCTTPSGIGSFVTGSNSKGTRTIQVSVRFTSRVTITAATVQTASNNFMDRLNINGNSYRCGSGRRLSPCPAASGQTASLTPAYDIGNFTGTRTIPFISRFTASVAGETQYTLTLTYSSGCDIISVPNP